MKQKKATLFVLLILSLVIMVSCATASRRLKIVAEIGEIKLALKRYRNDNGFYPTTEQGLMALVKKPTTEPIPVKYMDNGYLAGESYIYDPWGNPYLYILFKSGDKDYILKSLGADGKEGGEGENADIEEFTTRIR
jgi:general secretion pathway protein G